MTNTERLQVAKSVRDAAYESQSYKIPEAEEEKWRIKLKKITQALCRYEDEIFNKERNKVLKIRLKAESSYRAAKETAYNEHIKKIKKAEETVKLLEEQLKLEGGK